MNATQAIRKYRPHATIGLIGLVSLIAIWLGWDFIQQLVAVLSNRESVTEQVRAFGVWGPIFLALLLSLQVIISVIPGHVIMVVGGYLYGFWPALALHMAATVIASQVAFLIARRAGRPLINHVASSALLDKWNRIADKQGFSFYLLFFWFPIVPSGIMNFVAGLSRISFWHFLAASIVGRLPGVALTTLVGSHGLELSLGQWLVLGAVGLLVFVGGRFAANKLQAKYDPSST